MTLWEDAVARSRGAVAVALADGGLDRLAARNPWGEPQSLRRMIVDMNEEYARHTGHADLIRESIDGLVGEDPPRVRSAATPQGGTDAIGTFHW